MWFIGYVVLILVALYYAAVILWTLYYLHQDRKELRAGMALASTAARRRTEKCTINWHQRVRTVVPLSDQFSASWRYKQERALRAALMTEGLLSADASSISRKLAQELWASLGPARHW